jgi:hypothetical protein
MIGDSLFSFFSAGSGADSMTRRKHLAGGVDISCLGFWTSRRVGWQTPCRGRRLERIGIDRKTWRIQVAAGDGAVVTYCGTDGRLCDFVDGDNCFI